MFRIYSRDIRPSAVVRHGFSIMALLSVLLVSCPVNCEETLTNRMRVISEDLDRQLNGIMASQALNYTAMNTTGLPYNATTKFNPKGMGQLYNVTNMFIDFVQSRQAYPEGECFKYLVNMDAERLVGLGRAFPRPWLRPVPARSKMAGYLLVNRSLSKKKM